MNNHSFSIRAVSPSMVYEVRHPVLRPGKPLESCLFDGDLLDSTVHFGLFEGDKLAGVASLFENKSMIFEQKRQFQLRGMAILDEYQNKGYGKRLLNRAEDYARRQEADLLWFNARLIAVPFYENCGYQSIGDAFDIGDIGAHYVMFKILG